MNLFETVKSAVTVKQAAEHYGCKVNRGDMICCPFHDDRHPSMKLNERYFYCFGCGATGDVIDLVAKLLGLSSYEAAKKLAYGRFTVYVRTGSLAGVMPAPVAGTHVRSD